MTDTKVNLKLVVADPPKREWTAEELEAHGMLTTHGMGGMRSYTAGTGGKGEAFDYSGAYDREQAPDGSSFALWLRLVVYVFLAAAVVILIFFHDVAWLAFKAILSAAWADVLGG